MERKYKRRAVLGEAQQEPPPIYGLGEWHVKRSEDGETAAAFPWQHCKSCFARKRRGLANLAEVTQKP